LPDEPSQAPAPPVSEPAAAGPPDPLIGTTIDRYRVVQVIGEGGMGRVYSVEHVLLRKRMAMKLLRAEYGRNPELVRRFQNEAVAASSIGQENIVSVTDFGYTQDGIVYLVMEELQGLSLAQAIHEEPAFPPARALAIAAQICKAFAAAHAAGIVHRDLKPDNVFLVRRPGQEFAKILDFGISKVAEELTGGDAGERLTKTGMILGTPEYMSPEQSAGRPVDLRTDIYSWGIVLFEMLTGCLPFQADNPVAMLMKHQAEPPATLKDVRPDLELPDALERIVRKALAKRVQDRYQTMGEALADLPVAEPQDSTSKAPAPVAATTPPAGPPASDASKAPPLSPTYMSAAAPAPRPPAEPASPPERATPPMAARSRPTPSPTPAMAGRPQGSVSSLTPADRLQLLRPDLRKETLTPEEGFVASRLIGFTPTLEELLQTSGLPRQQSLDIINSLLGKGIVGRRAGSVVRPPPGAASELARGQERKERTKDNPFVSRFVRKQVLVRRGQESLSRGHFQEALTSFRTALALDTKDADLIRIIDDTQGRITDAEAEKLFQEGVAAERAKDFTAALERFQKAMNLRPGNARYLERVARKLFYQEGAFNEAKRLVDRAVQLQPNDPDARATLARAYLIAGLKDRAKKELQLVLTLNKDHKFAKQEMKRLRWW
jgi:serine/threonine protein kinase